MPTNRKEERFAFPGIKPGSWRGEILDRGTVNFGQVVQAGPPRQAVEFSFMVVPASFTMPDPSFTWPGIVMIGAPTPLKPECLNAGDLFKSDRLPTLTLSLDVTRAQFSDMLRMLEANALKNFHFTHEEEGDGTWPVLSWGMDAAFK
jgi:hypothetical protein